MGKWLGAILIIVGCGGAGLTMAAGQLREERMLRQLVMALDLMECELQYRLTPLPELCRQAAGESRGGIQKILEHLAAALDREGAKAPSACLEASLLVAGDLPEKVREGFRLLGTTLGRFDLEGQLRGMESVRAYCRRQLQGMEINREARLRSYQTLGLCAGAALAIVLI